MRERRNRTDRRDQRTIHGPSRRSHERRDFPRELVALDVREPRGKLRPCYGDLSAEGAAFITTAPPMGDLVELRFTLPCYEGPIFARARVVARSGAVQGAQISTVFTDIDVEAELAIAEWLQERTAARADRPG